MVNTELSLDVSKSLSLKTIRLFDTSFYYNNEPVFNYLVEVLPANRSEWVVFHVDKGFSLVLNSSNLRYQKAKDEDRLLDLPDGIYEIKQSIQPNIHTLTLYYHFRIAELLNKIQNERDALLDDRCSLSRSEYYRNRDRLRDIEEYAYASQWKVEERNDKKKGKELYDFASKLLEQYTNECQC